MPTELSREPLRIGLPTEVGRSIPGQMVLGLMTAGYREAPIIAHPIEINEETKP